MIKNKRNIALPPKNGSDFKELFKYATDIGVGLPTGGDGLPIGTWTPKKLAAALSAIEANKVGVDLRAVQHWFEDNDKGISASSINLLARVFGGDDSEATTAWRSELTAGQRRLVAKRKANKSKTKNQLKRAVAANRVPMKPWPAHTIPVGELPDPSSVQTDTSDISSVGHHPKTLAERRELIMSGAASMNLLIVYWLVFCGLGLINYVFNTLNVTYSPLEGLNKQVGFIWAPTLTVLPLVALPAFIYYVSELITYWKRVGRSKFMPQGGAPTTSLSDPSWHAKLNNFTFSFWAIALFCFLFVFGFQWAGIYLPAYLSGDANGVQIDRYLVALVRPEIISIAEAMLLSFVGYLYTASYITVFMLGLLFFVIIVLDFHDVCTTLDVESDEIKGTQIREVGQKILWGGFRVVVFALWLATLIKLQITYLSSDSSDFLSWVRIDMMGAFDVTSLRNGLLENSSISHFTTFMMMAVTVSVFIFGILRVRSCIESLAVYDRIQRPKRDYLALLQMLGVIALLSIGLVLVGRFTGFSIVVGISASASLLVLSGPKLRTD